MTSKKRRGRGKHGNQQSQIERGTPTWYLKQYKTTQRPVPCERCRQNAYYNHKDYGYLCAPHLLDLVNIGGTAFNWDEYPEMWERTERLLQRPAPPLSTTAKNMEQPLETRPAKPKSSLDGSQTQENI